MEISKSSIKLIPLSRWSNRKAPMLDQIIKPETDTLSNSLFKARPHPPISRKKVDFFNSYTKIR